jgi:hypothetical protein
MGALGHGRKGPGAIWRRSGVLLALGVAALTIGSAQAASSKPFTANVHQTLNTPGSFTLTLTNDPRAQQALGSGNFTAPANFTVPTSSQTFTTADGHTWTVASDGSNVVTFRAATNGDALGKGQSVSASVAVNVPAQTQCTSALWQVQARQSNDFSGPPGNAMTFDPTHSDMTPLGSFVVAPVETVITTVDPALHIPQVLVNVTKPVSVTAKDTCGNTDSDFSGATLNEVHTPPRFTTSSLSWSAGVGSASFKPVNVEVQDQLRVSDSVTGIGATSNSFDVVETICAVAGTTCTWQNKNKTINATSTIPDNTASLGLGFMPPPSGTCTVDGGSLSAKSDALEIDPVAYAGSYTITITYAKSVSGTGSTPFVLCISKDGGQTWTAAPDCDSTVPVNTTPCVQSRKRVTGGALEIILLLSQGDPGSAGFG